MSWQTPVTNWTAQSYFNYTDFNRIEGNSAAIATLLQACGYNVTLTTITSRDYSTLDFYDSLNRIEGNILALFNSYAVAPLGWILPKTTWSYDQPFSYLDTNRIEGNELALYNMVSGIIQEYPVCGQSLSICGLGWRN
ncbi:MAG: hypothetical protein ACYCVD_16850 [Desulfitobacteriaceae bacterium]